jgi:hypothetical protein
MVDRRGENIEYASEWINVWAGEAGLRVEVGEVNSLRLSGEFHNIVVRFERADVFDFMKENEQPADLLIAHAFLDLLPMPDSLAKLLLLTNDSAWLTLNFDGVTSIEPVIDPALDEQIERLYHISMDTRPTGGNSRSGRLLFEHLRDRGAEILAAGASDWVVHAANGKYPDDEAYFLEFILHFIEDSLAGHPLLNADAFANWLKVRRQQIDRGELVYIAHQMDFFIKMKPTLMADRII